MTPEEQLLLRELDSCNANLDGEHRDDITEDAASLIRKLADENENLRSVMVAAAEEINAHWDAHCDNEGYGPANLLRRLEQGLAADYPGYKPGSLRKQSEQIDKLARALNDCPTDCDAIGVYGEWRERNADALKIAAER